LDEAEARLRRCDDALPCQHCSRANLTVHSFLTPIPHLVPGVDTFDVVVLGVYYSKSNTTGRAASAEGQFAIFLCGILEERLDAEPPAMRTYTCSSGTRAHGSVRKEAAAAADDALSSGQAIKRIMERTKTNFETAELAIYGNLPEADDAGEAADSVGGDIGEAAPEHYPNVFPFCKVGTGFNMEQLAAWRKQLMPHLVRFDHKKPPAHLKQWTAKADDRPHFWIPLDKTLVFEVNFGEIISTDQFAGGLTLRFPRLHKNRTDKPWFQCETVADVREFKDTGSNPRAAEKRAAHEFEKAEAKASKQQKPATGKPRPAPIQSMAQTDMSGT
jgi:hypothetical protein